MGSPSPSLISSTMHTFVLLSIVSLACAAPMPQEAVEAEAPAAVEEEAPAALPYVHDATGDVAEPYVHEEIPAVEAAAEEEIAAEPYVHEEIAAEAYVHDATGDVAEEYVHVRTPRQHHRWHREHRLQQQSPHVRKAQQRSLLRRQLPQQGSPHGHKVRRHHR